MCSCEVVSQSGNYFNVNCQGPNGNRFYSVQASNKIEALQIARDLCTNEVSAEQVTERISDVESEGLKKYSEDLSNLTDEYKPLFTNCIINKEGKCGDYGFGSVDYLVNSSGTQKYRVLVRTVGNYGSVVPKDDVYIVDPWSRIKLGCDQVPGSTPTIRLTRMIVGEVAI
ncbi:hypothetical protein CRN76_04590 [Chryseobacterium indologenes]|nr:hypothetical protein CRN76_04590 [Chryseobacterium indologenes]GAE63299.1 hypothetical protein CIN01S_03_01270 [Chryseobacterium indologenes NBRC 14944]SFJ14692.1 hypothetical protein SAMN05421692_1228 [Chryseobacterium indologenes]SUX49181.1 Uncharacterised protein [Chryseobacterium indologenes]